MLAHVNQTHLLGLLGADPTVRQTQSGISVANMSVATTKRYTNKRTGEPGEQTSWHKVVAWDALAKVAEGLRKGQAVYVMGELMLERYTNQEGVQREKTIVKAERLVGVADAREQQGDRGGAPPGGSHGGGYGSAPASFGEEEIPF